MGDTITTVFGLLFSAIFATIGWVIKMIFAQLSEHRENHENLKDEVAATKLYAANTYAAKTDISVMRREIVDAINSLSDKIDRIHK